MLKKSAPIHKYPTENNTVRDSILFAPKMVFSIAKFHKIPVFCKQMECIRCKPTIFRSNLNRAKYSIQCNDQEIHISPTQWFETPSLPIAIIKYNDAIQTVSIVIRPPFFVRSFLYLGSRIGLLFIIVLLIFSSPMQLDGIVFSCFCLICLYIIIAFSFWPKANELQMDIIQSLEKTKGQN
jgi:hypothetical protein